MKKTILVKTKKDLVDRVVNETNIARKDAISAVNAVFDEIAQTLIDGGEISVVGFGKFEVVEKEERVAFNPAKGEKVTVPATRTPKFRAGKTLKDAVKNG